MSIIRRSFAAFVGVLLLQLTLLGSGTLCALHHAASRAGVAGHEMHDMNGMTVTNVDHLANASAAVADAGSGPTSSGDCGGFGRHDGCGLPWAPGQCSSMTACDITATPSASGVVSDAVQVVAIAAPAPAPAYSGPTFAPELPPPRA